MLLKPGTRLASTVCASEVIVVKAPAVDVDVRCGGAPMVVKGDAAGHGDSAVAPDHAAGTVIGKRYGDEGVGLELLCTTGGQGSLSLGDSPLLLRDAKQLPASD